VDAGPLRRLVAALLLAVGAAACLDVASADAATVTYRVDAAASALTFLGTSRLVNAEGRFHRFRGEVTLDPSNLATARVALSIEAASLDTDNDLRDQHLRSDAFFWVERHPVIAFESARVEGAGGRANVVGRLTLRGVTREVLVPVEIEVGDRTLVARGAFELRRVEYGMTYQSWLNPVGNVVRIAFTFRATRVAP